LTRSCIIKGIAADRVRESADRTNKRLDAASVFLLFVHKDKEGT